MTTRNLKGLFSPESIAVIGASERSGSVGSVVLKNVLQGEYQGLVFPVNPKYDEIHGVKAYRSLNQLPSVPDLAVICTPPETVRGIIRNLGRLGTKAAIVLTAGPVDHAGKHDVAWRDNILAAARPSTLRVLGPNCVGLLLPNLGLNASFAHTGALKGKLAFVSQSGALVTAVLDWAKARGIGFSKFISLGDSADVDFADILDYLAADRDTNAILLYMEDIKDARKFMSAARIAARSKPTLVLKAGRVPEGAKAASSHTGAMTGSDEIYDAAIRRAGMLRLTSTEDMFSAVETLACAKPLSGNRMAIVTNGGGPGVMATDALISCGGRLAVLSDETMASLDDDLPSNWSHGNPVDIIGDAPVERYVRALKSLLRDKNIDAILFIHAPTAIVPSVEIARAVAPLIAESGRSVFTCWLGGAAVAAAKNICLEAGIPCYETPEEAVQGFYQISQYRCNQELLMQAPAAAEAADEPDQERARALVARVHAAGGDALGADEAAELLEAYGIPVASLRRAVNAESAAQCATEIGFPVALKILSPEISHKSDVGGVRLALQNAGEVRRAAFEMWESISAQCPGASLQGYLVQTMVQRLDAQELILGVATDPLFGPIILFGHGGTAVEILQDKAVALPPLNSVLAQDLVARTQISKVLRGYRNTPPADMKAICHCLLQISRLINDFPEIIELDINPLLADHRGVVALDARIKLNPEAAARQRTRMAICPYPKELEETVPWNCGTVLLRPIKPEDSVAHVEFFQRLTPEDVRYRMFVGLHELSPALLARFTQIDYDREMAFIATRATQSQNNETLGVVRMVADPDRERAEFAIVVRSDLKGQGLGTLLMRKLIAYCSRTGMRAMYGEALPDNAHMLNLATYLNFKLKRSEDGETTLLELDLVPDASD